jgi:hypothetical protein
MHKENHSVDAIDYMDYVDYTDYRSEASELPQDGPTVHSIAAALAAQQRERAAFTQDTGIQLNRDGRLLHPSSRLRS